MAKKTVGELIKEARTGAGMTQEQLAKKIKGVSANDISMAERGQAELTQAVLKEIAKATGVTQSSLIEAAKSSKPAAKKTSSTAKKTSTAKTSTAKKSTASTSSMKVTAAEKKLVELYRAADSATKKDVIKKLKGESTDLDDIFGDVLGNALEMLGKLGKDK